MPLTRYPTRIAIAVAVICGCAGSAHAQQPWSAMAGTCAGTDHNFFNGQASADFPVARFITPGGSLTFSTFHQGYLSAFCTVDNPRYGGTQVWNRLQVTYRDPDGLQTADGWGRENQVYVELVRMSKVSGALSRIARFDSNLQCQSITTTSCAPADTVRTFDLPFTHTFDFNNYAYAVFARLWRGNQSFKPVIYQVRLEAAAIVNTP
jgi:hypothetical protein